VFTFDLTVTDDDGGSASMSTVTLTSYNVAPVATITGAPATADKASLLSLGSTVTDLGPLDTFTYAWSVTRNGSPYSTGTPTTASTLGFTPGRNGLYVVSLVVTDNDGGARPAVTATIQVGPGLSDVTASTSIAEGQAATLAGRILNPDALPMPL